MNSWSFNYYRIINRYESTIVGQFFGHNHHEEIRLFYDLDEPNRPTNLAYLGGGVTTEPTLNPGYRIYTVDGGYLGASYFVTDFDSYILNITEANLTNKPTCKKAYSAKVKTTQLYKSLDKAFFRNFIIITNFLKGNL